MTESRVKFTLVIIWLISFLVSGFGLWNERVYSILVGVLIVICLQISAFSYVRICRIVRRHQLQIHAQQQAVQSSDAANNLNITRLKRSAMNTFVFYIVLTVCYFRCMFCQFGMEPLTKTGKQNGHLSIVWYLVTRPSIHFCIAGVFASFARHF